MRASSVGGRAPGLARGCRRGGAWSWPIWLLGLLAACVADAPSITAAPTEQAGVTEQAGASAADGPTAEAGEPVEFACPPFPTHSEGSFFLDDAPERRDLRAGSDGRPLEVEVTLVDAVTCRPLDGQLVHLWGADPHGEHSGLATADDERRHLRGQQVTDADGTASFTTIFPGWLPGHPPHLTLTTELSDSQWFTARLAFADQVADAVYASAPYRERGAAAVRSADAADPASVIAPVETGDRWRLDVTLAVDPTLVRQPPVSAHREPEPALDDRRPPDTLVDFDGLPDAVRSMFERAAAELEIDARELHDQFADVGPQSPPDVPAIAEHLGVSVEALADALPLLAAGAPEG